MNFEVLVYLHDMCGEGFPLRVNLRHETGESLKAKVLPLVVKSGMSAIHSELTVSFAEWDIPDNVMLAETGLAEGALLLADVNLDAMYVRVAQIERDAMHMKGWLVIVEGCELHRFMMCRGVEWGFQYHNFYGDWLLCDTEPLFNERPHYVHNTMYGGQAHLYHMMDRNYNVPRWVRDDLPFGLLLLLLSLLDWLLLAASLLGIGSPLTLSTLSLHSLYPYRFSTSLPLTVLCQSLPLYLSLFLI